MIAPADALAGYEARLAPHREGFATGRALSLLPRAAGDDALLLLFLIHFAAWGIAMTRPVDGWMRRAGERCRTGGWPELGTALIDHAAHEAGHHRMMVADLWSLTERWNRRHAPRIDPIAITRTALPEGVRRYRALHEQVIAGEAPFAQIAVEYEIEALSVRHGPALAAAAKRATGRDGGTVGEGVSFLREHVALDVAHTRFNRHQIARLLARDPACLGALAEAGAQALAAYARFVEDCLDAALAFDGRGASDGLDCRLFAPPGEAAARRPPDWLLWVRALRSHVLYDHGARPAFGPGGGEFGDPDPADLHCHHLVLFDGELPVGAARLRLPPGGGPSLIAAAFGTATAERSLAAHGIGRPHSAEASGLVLHPDYRRGRAARRLIAGLWALAAESGARALVAAVGTASRQDRLFALFGAEMLEDAGRVHVPRYRDDLRLALYPVDADAPPDYPEIDHMRECVRRALHRAPAAAA